MNASFSLFFHIAFFIAYSIGLLSIGRLFIHLNILQISHSSKFLGSRFLAHLFFLSVDHNVNVNCYWLLIFNQQWHANANGNAFKGFSLGFKDPGRSKYNHTSMESLVDVEYKYIRVNIVFPFHKLQDAERTSHCPPPPSYVTYLVRLAETLMTSFRVGVE